MKFPVIERISIQILFYGELPILSHPIGTKPSSQWKKTVIWSNFQGKEELIYTDGGLSSKGSICKQCLVVLIKKCEYKIPLKY